MFRQHVQNVIHPAVEANQLQQSARHQGDDNQFAHADNPLSHRAEPPEHVETAVTHPHDAGRHDAQQQHQRNIDTRYRRSQHDEVRNHLAPRYLLHFVCRLDTRPAHNVVDEYEQRGRQGDEQVDTEFVAHHASLRAGGGDGGIGYKRQVIAKERPSYHQRGNEGKHPGVGFFGDACRHGHQCNDGSHRRADRERDEARGEEHSGKQQTVGQEVKSKVDRSINGSHRFCRLSECSRKDEYPNHEHDVLVSRPRRVLQDAVVQAQSLRNGNGIDRRYQEGDGDRHFIEIVDNERSNQIEAQKHHKRTERPCAGLVDDGGQFIRVHR